MRVCYSNFYCLFLFYAPIFFSCACSKIFILFRFVFWVQRYCFFITLTIGFEEYFGELKTVNKFKGY